MLFYNDILFIPMATFVVILFSYGFSFIFACSHVAKHFDLTVKYCADTMRIPSYDSASTKFAFCKIKPFAQIACACFA